jgi:hypothetical protein
MSSCLVASACGLGLRTITISANAATSGLCCSARSRGLLSVTGVNGTTACFATGCLYVKRFDENADDECYGCYDDARKRGFQPGHMRCSPSCFIKILLFAYRFAISSPLQLRGALSEEGKTYPRPHLERTALCRAMYRICIVRGDACNRQCLEYFGFFSGRKFTDPG